MQGATGSTAYGFKGASPAADRPTIEAIVRRGAELEVSTSTWTNDHLQLHGPTWDGLTDRLRAGVTAVLAQVRGELETDAALCGIADVRRVPQDLVVREVVR